MKMGRKHFYFIGTIAAFAAMSLLISFLVWRRWANQNDFIDQEQAIQNAIHACNPTYGLQTVEQPTVFETQFTTLGSTMNPSNPDADRRVWVIKLKGRWLHVSGGPLPSQESHPEPSYWNECTIVIDAQSGKSLTPPIQ